jgi:hypothetical protein
MKSPTSKLRIGRSKLPLKKSVEYVKNRLWFILNSDMRPFYDRSYNGPPINPELKEDLS